MLTEPLPVSPACEMEPFKDRRKIAEAVSVGVIESCPEAVIAMSCLAEAVETESGLNALKYKLPKLARAESVLVLMFSRSVRLEPMLP
jgi:hypothetical protein